MTHLDALVGIVALMAFSLWVVGKARSDGPFIARILHRRFRDHPGGVQENDDVRWHWHPR
jgi:hypothetical protein